jgi:hypothetical protein
MKIKWDLCKEEDVEKFKADLRGHTASIELLLLAIQMWAFLIQIVLINSTNSKHPLTLYLRKNTSIQARKQDDQHKTLSNRIQETSTLWMQKLVKIADSAGRYAIPCFGRWILIHY